MTRTPTERQALAEEYAADIARMRNCLRVAGLDVSTDHVVQAWHKHSEMLRAGWLVLPEDDETLLAILQKHLPPQSDATLPPPSGYKTWLDYAVENLDTRDLHNSSIFDTSLWGREVDRREFLDAARRELESLRAMAAEVCHKDDRERNS
jgi:hypothetical protein